MAYALEAGDLLIYSSNIEVEFMEYTDSRNCRIKTVGAGNEHVVETARLRRPYDYFTEGEHVLNEGGEFVFRRMVNDSIAELRTLDDEYGFHAKTIRIAKLEPAEPVELKTSVDECNVLSEREYWVTSEGNKLFPHEFEDEHLANTVRMLKRKANEHRKRDAMEKTIKYRNIRTRGEQDLDRFYRNNRNIMNSFMQDGKSDEEWLKLHSRIFVLLLEEATYRGLDLSPQRNNYSRNTATTTGSRDYAYTYNMGTVQYSNGSVYMNQPRNLASEVPQDEPYEEEDLDEPTFDDLDWMCPPSWDDEPAPEPVEPVEEERTAQADLFIGNANIGSVPLPRPRIPRRLSPRRISAGALADGGYTDSSGNPVTFGQGEPTPVESPLMSTSQNGLPAGEVHMMPPTASQGRSMLSMGYSVHEAMESDSDNEEVAEERPVASTQRIETRTWSDSIMYPMPTVEQETARTVVERATDSPTVRFAGGLASSFHNQQITPDVVERAIRDNPAVQSAYDSLLEHLQTTASNEPSNVTDEYRNFVASLLRQGR